MQKSTKTNPNIPIIYEDNHLLVIDKPVGVLSQEDITGKPDVLTLCKQYLKKEYNKPGNVYLGLVHRLDQPVSGVMVLAKTSKAASRLSEQIRKNMVVKTYWAMVHGTTNPEEHLIHHLAKDKKKNFVHAHNSKKSFTKKSELSYKTIKQNTQFSLVEVDLITGRPHQIRVQLAKIGHPLWGDVKYGDNSSAKGVDLGLRAVKFTLEHPTTKEKMTFEVDMPKIKPWSFFDY